MREIWIPLFLVSLLLWIPSCAVNPVTGKQELMLMSEKEEIDLGRETDTEILKQYGPYEDPKLTAYVHEIGQRLSQLSHRSQLTYHFKLVDASVLNAFAVPGGYVYLTRGILAVLNSEAELAGVVGHEIGHIAARHSAQQYSKAQIAQLGLGVGSLFLDSPILTSLTQLGVGMLFMRFSRDNEREADDLAVAYSSKAGYDATQMASFFETLERINPGADRSGLPGWFTTHPSPENRIQAVRTGAKEWQQRLNLKERRVEKENYLRKIDGLIYGDDPRQGYEEANIFYHPTLQLQFPVPPNWKIKNRPSYVQMTSEKEDALLLFLLAKGPSSSEATKAFVSQTGALVVRSEKILVGGFSTYRIYSDIRTQKGTLRVLSYFIEKEGKVYAFHGLTSVERFQNYKTVFEHTMDQFKRLVDPKRIHVKPDRIRIHATRTTDTLENGLRSYGVPNDKMKEMALMNGRGPQEVVQANTLIKVVEKGH